jgi:hypothetical protein
VREALYKVAVDWRYIAIPRQLSVFNLPFQTYLIFSEFNWLPIHFLSLSSRSVACRFGAVIASRRVEVEPTHTTANKACSSLLILVRWILRTTIYRAGL